MTTQNTESIATEDMIRLQLMKSRLTKLEATETQIRKLNHVLGSMAVSERPRQLSLLRQAAAYVQVIAGSAPAGLRSPLDSIGNELQSLREGLVAQIVKPKDLVLLSGARAVKDIGLLKSKLQGHIVRAESRINSTTGGSPAENLLLKTKEISTQIPNLNGKDYAVIRAPVAFTFTAPNGKHSSVGYVDSEKLQHMGFKVDNLEGYTIIHGQMLIGVNTDALYVHDEAGNKSLETVIEHGMRFKADKPIKTQTKRPKNLLDLANEVLKLIETKTKTSYALVSTTPARHGDGLWYWVAPSRDLTRMGKAFPGGHVRATGWGPAFPVDKNSEELRRAAEERRKNRPIVKEAR